MHTRLSTYTIISFLCVGFLKGRYINIWNEGSLRVEPPLDGGTVSFMHDSNLCRFQIQVM